MDKRKILINLPSKNFWITNSTIWGIASIFNLLMQYFRSNGNIESTIISIIPIVWCFILTSLLRIYWGIVDIYKLNFKKLIISMIPHSLITTLLCVLLGIGNILIIVEYKKSIVNLLIGNYLSLYFLILLWITLYFLIIFYTKFRNKDIEYLKLQNSLQTAQLLNLKNQLNPHFLFNALNNIRSLIRENPESARMMISSLTDILRYSLNSSNAKFVKIKDEIEFVKEYLALEHLHMENRLNYLINVDEEIEDIKIPPMIIQLLTENAIKHGLSKIPNGGSLTITIANKYNDIEIEVKNNGTLNNQKQNSGIGIVNIRERISLIYGDKGIFTLKQENNFVIALIQLPKENII